MSTFSLKLDIDECSSDTSPCDQNADCNNSDGSYSCACKRGFSGDGVACTGLYFATHCFNFELSLHLNPT